MSTLGMSCRVVVGALLVGLTASCSQPPPPSAETAALEGSLLTGADVGGSFVVESRGQRRCGHSNADPRPIGKVTAASLHPPSTLTIPHVIERPQARDYRQSRSDRYATLCAVQHVPCAPIVLGFAAHCVQLLSTTVVGTTTMSELQAW